MMNVVTNLMEDLSSPQASVGELGGPFRSSKTAATGRLIRRHAIRVTGQVPSSKGGLCGTSISPTCS